MCNRILVLPNLLSHDLSFVSCSRPLHVTFPCDHSEEVKGLGVYRLKENQLSADFASEKTIGTGQHRDNPLFIFPHFSRPNYWPINYSMCLLL